MRLTVVISRARHR